MVRQTCKMLRHAGSSHDQGMLTKEQERELRVYVTQLSHVNDTDTQQSLLQEGQVHELQSRPLLA